MVDARARGPCLGVRLMDRNGSLQGVLDGLAASPGMVGAVLVSRDGFCMMKACNRLSNPEVFSAMAAAFVGAAEAALLELGEGGAPRILVETPHTRLLALPATEGMLLIAIAQTDMEPAALEPRVEDAAVRISVLVKG